MKKKHRLLHISGFFAIALTILSVSEAHMKSKVPFEPLTLWDMERFHGHIGPFVVLGARLGEHAVTTHKIPRYFGIDVKVECPAGPPPTCIIDGLQLATGATMGKGNISHVAADSGFRIRIQDVKARKEMIYTIESGVLLSLKRWGDDGLSVEERGRRIFKMNVEDLFCVDVRLDKDEKE